MSGAEPDLLVDQAARDRIAADLGTTLFVEAGAGSGKTTALVDRIVALVTDPDGVAMQHVAAITFTEKAAAELRDRIRTRLEQQRRAEPDGTDAAARLSDALDQLDGAAVSTLHAFAQRILREHPIEAGLPPGVEVLDEVRSIVDFEDRWRSFVDELFDPDAATDDRPDISRSLLLAVTARIGLADLRNMARILDDNWDQIEGRVDLSPPPPSPVDAEPLMRVLREMLDQAPRCLDPDDKLLAALETEVEPLLRTLEDAADESEQMTILRAEKPTMSYGGKGRKDAWPDGGKADVLALAAEARALRANAADAVLEGAMGQILGRLAEFTLRSAEQRAREGRLTFHDLLVLARRVLRHPDHGPGVRRALAERYRRLLLDEFQDTDPIQIELAVLLAGTGEDSGAGTGAGAGDLDWSGTPTEPGRLFFVGDPKQSIYRFRRADIATFLRARDTFSTDPVVLNQNFRSVGPVIDWVNHVFDQLIVADGTSQPAYQPLAAVRPAPAVGPAVAMLGTGLHTDQPDADELRRREADDVAAVIDRAMADGWTVGDGPDTRPARPGDVTILVPSRMSLPHLERALEARGIPYRADASSLVYTTVEVRDLLMVARAVDDPTDELALVAALRSPAFGCGDDDLYVFKVDHGGTWNHQVTPPDTLLDDHPVVAAMRYLGDLHHRRWWMTPSDVLTEIARHCRMFELGVVGGRPRDLWRRLRFVIDQARAYGDSVGGSLRDFLTWADLQGDESARVAETVLPETDIDTVSIMTVHAAKGLEFPICVLSGMSTQQQHRPARVRVEFPPGTDEVALRVGKAFENATYERFLPVDEQMDRHERLRLLYVAATRARDHLVVSTHRRERAGTPTAAELLHTAAQGADHEVFEDTLSLSQPGATGPTVAGPVERPPRHEWAAELERRHAAGRRVSTLAATTLAVATTDGGSLFDVDPERDDGQLALTFDDGVPGAPESPADDDAGLAKDGRDLDLPPWNKGRYGTAIGRAVHGVLQTVDLATGDGLDGLARAQASAEGASAHVDAVAALARSALAAPVVRQAAALPHWREVYVGAPVGSGDGAVVVEGYVDLLVRTPAGLVVVDHKTDQVADLADLDAKVDRYRLQGAVYALATEVAVGEPVVGVTFVFCRTDGPAVERSIDDLAAAVAEVRDRAPAVAADPRPPLTLV